MSGSPVLMQLSSQLPEGFWAAVSCLEQEMVHQELATPQHRQMSEAESSNPPQEGNRVCVGVEIKLKMLIVTSPFL